MFQVSDVWDEAGKIINSCNEPLLLRWLSDSVTLIANKADFEGWRGYLDICSTSGGTCISLPREVDSVYGVNINGNPSLGVGQLFNFHLNGPGDCSRGCELKWQDLGGMWPVYQDITVPSKVVAHVEKESDNGAEFIIYGYDSAGNPLRRENADGTWSDGYQVPVIYGYAIPDDVAPTIARIDRVFKARTNGTLRLSTIDNDGNFGTLLAVYEPDETHPQYRRIKLNRACSWVRIAFRRTSPIFRSQYDHVPLKSRLAFLLAFRAVKKYSEGLIADAHAFEADAARLELEAQNASEPVTYTPVQVLDHNGLNDKTDYDIR